MKKAWTPDNCPLQVGSVVHEPITNSDRMVTRRYLCYEDNHIDEEKALIKFEDNIIYTGKELMDNGYTYYPDWPSTGHEKPCYDEVEEPVLISNLVMSIFDGLRSAHIAKEGVHYDKDGTINIWDDDLATAVHNAADDLAKIFKEFKHDEQ